MDLVCTSHDHGLTISTDHLSKMITTSSNTNVHHEMNVLPLILTFPGFLRAPAFLTQQSYQYPPTHTTVIGQNGKHKYWLAV